MQNIPLDESYVHAPKPCVCLVTMQQHVGAHVPTPTADI